ncbi:hypothetical protein [Blastopirellula marina]|uniref:Xylose isomerase-like TIM barrel domain-containing protein n=1 Tax=Blastopirellula marina TaxID=124 RepID=A0A2S8FWS8_9BACT|nr:hypothetical protein [Blastopirellula marina]PQO36613.1 hypothetical protein C5Y98_11495 [Blastopirellula marina]PTL44443.1 hypothetical protein C5Y97_11505 [Blastopirellula marina]
MRRIGFSTGALAKSDFREGIRLQLSIANAIELSALREDELDPLVSALPRLELRSFDYVSFHAPSNLSNWSEADLVSRLRTLPNNISTIVVHPNIIQDFQIWRTLGDRLSIENMDQRYEVGRTSKELEIYFENLPEARFCFDIGHARQIDPTMSIAKQLLRDYEGRLSEIHISEVDAESHHCMISSITCKAFQRILADVDQGIPAIIESVVVPSDITEEFQMVQFSFCEPSCDKVKPGSSSVPM